MPLSLEGKVRSHHHSPGRYCCLFNTSSSHGMHNILSHTLPVSSFLLLDLSDFSREMKKP